MIKIVGNAIFLFSDEEEKDNSGTFYTIDKSISERYNRKK